MSRFLALTRALSRLRGGGFSVVAPPPNGPSPTLVVTPIVPEPETGPFPPNSPGWTVNDDPQQDEFNYITHADPNTTDTSPIDHLTPPDKELPPPDPAPFV